MIYLLDTNTCIGYINRRSLPIFRRLSALATEDVCLCDVVKFELYYGAYRSSRQQTNLQILQEFFSQFISLPFDGVAA
jgi:tRNA(fMet)-specific endonuclease VapC